MSNIKTIKTILENASGKKPYRSSRTKLIGECMRDLKIKGENFVVILMQTRQFTESEIFDIKKKAMAWETNPPALFWKLSCLH